MDGIFWCPEDFATRSTRFTAFMQTKGLLEILMGSEALPMRPNILGNEPTDEQKQAQEDERVEFRKAVKNLRKQYKEVWCYLAMILDNTSWMLLRHDWLGKDAMGNGQKAWRMLITVQ